jgi:hypothetical protein
MCERMNQNDLERIYFNQNMLYHKDKTYNSGGSLEVSICNNTTDYKTFSAPTLHISVIGENNLRRLCSLNYPDSVDLFVSIKDILANIETIYSTNRNNVLLKKYQFDRSLKFEFIQIQNMGDRVVSISVIHSSSDFTKVVVPYSVFSTFAIGILKYFVNEFVKISFDFSSRNLLTEILEQNKMIRNGIMILPSTLIENKANIDLIQNSIKESNEEFPTTNIEETIDDFDKFLGKDMENIQVPDLNSKVILEEKPKNLEVNSLLINKTLTKDLSVLESMLSAAITRPDPMISIFEGFRRSMNLDSSFSFLPNINKDDLKSLLYISKITHDTYLNLYINKNVSIPSGFQILKYKVDDINSIDPFNINLAYDILLIFGFIKEFRSRMESRESDANKNGALFYLRLRTFLDPLAYSFINPIKSKIILNSLSTNFEKYSELGFFNHYQNILTTNGFKEITVSDIRNFCNELYEKVLKKEEVFSVTIDGKHKDLYKTGFLRINSDNNLSIEQIINELVPLEVLEKNGVDLTEGSDNLKKVLENMNVSETILNIFHKKDIVEKPAEVKKESVSNILKTVKFFNNEIPEKYRNEFFNYIENLKNNNYDFSNSIYEEEELGDNIVKALYVWNESDNKKEPLTTFRTKLEDCLLTKELIIAKYRSTIENNKSKEDEWNFELL